MKCIVGNDWINNESDDDIDVDTNSNVTIVEESKESPVLTLIHPISSSKQKPNSIDILEPKKVTPYSKKIEYEEKKVTKKKETKEETKEETKYEMNNNSKVPDHHQGNENDIYHKLLSMTLKNRIESTRFMNIIKNSVVEDLRDIYTTKCEHEIATNFKNTIEVIDNNLTEICDNMRNLLLIPMEIKFKVPVAENELIQNRKGTGTYLAISSMVLALCVTFSGVLFMY